MPPRAGRRPCWLTGMSGHFLLPEQRGHVADWSMRYSVELSPNEAVWLSALAEVRSTSPETLLRLGLHRLRLSATERQQVAQRRQVDACLGAVE
jgi:hypothetical protein